VESRRGLRWGVGPVEREGAIDAPVGLWVSFNLADFLQASSYDRISNSLISPRGWIALLLDIRCLLLPGSPSLS
jgi:hypothetical protein